MLGMLLMSQRAQCAMCEEEPFSVPAPLDHVGVALMSAHMESEHGVRLGLFDLP